MNFSAFRKLYSGPVNKLAYLGMAGDFLVAFGLYSLWKYRNYRKELAAPAKKQKELEGFM